MTNGQFPMANVTPGFIRERFPTGPRRGIVPGVHA
jgi:hypothetical protein